jgi:hypothetical protein
MFYRRMKMAVKLEGEPPRPPPLISVYVQKKHEPPFYVGISRPDLSWEHVAQIMRINQEDIVRARVVQNEYEETHWLLIVK